jgi:hypothetical protein
MIQKVFESLEIRVEPADVDEDRFVSIWNVASATTDKDANLARHLASKFLGFLCKHRCDFVIASPTDAKYLDDWYERDNSLLNDWSPESDRVDVVAQHLHVPFEPFVQFLEANKFSPESNYNPRRAARYTWFTEDWNVG